MPAEAICSVCGKPLEPKKKWNEGTPVRIWLETCDCAAKEPAEVEPVVETIKGG